MTTRAVDTEQMLFDTIEVGQKWRLYYGPDNINNKLWHIRGKVDDQIIYRYWNKREWVYVAQSIFSFHWLVRIGILNIE